MFSDKVFQSMFKTCGEVVMGAFSVGLWLTLAYFWRWQLTHVDIS